MSNTAVGQPVTEEAPQDSSDPMPTEDTAENNNLENNPPAKPEIEKFEGNKQWLGGFRHKKSNAGIEQ